MDKHGLKDLIGKDTYDNLERVVILAQKKEIKKDEFDLAYQGLYEKAMKYSKQSEAVESTLGYIYLNVMKHYEVNKK